jgi:hypothetical protein
MPDDEFLRRIDAHMARGNEIMQRSNEVIEANRRTFEDLRTFLRELTLRHERALGAMASRIEEQTEMLREQRREFVEESRAQRAALFRMLDRLDGGGEAAAGA